MLAREKESHDNPAEFTQKARDLGRYGVVIVMAGLEEIGATHDEAAVWDSNTSESESQSAKDFLKDCYLDYTRLRTLADEEEQGSS
jgi:hypothetical protein